MCGQPGRCIEELCRLPTYRIPRQVSAGPGPLVGVPQLACTFAASVWFWDHPCVHWARLLSAAAACRSFMDAVADKLFVVEGDGPVRMFDGQFSEVGARLPADGFAVTSSGLADLQERFKTCTAAQWSRTDVKRCHCSTWICWGTWRSLAAKLRGTQVPRGVLHQGTEQQR